MQPPQSVEEVKATLETTEKGGVRQSIRNCLTVFQRDPVLAGAIAYNILTDRKDIIKPIGFHRESTALTDTDMKYLLLYLEETYGLTSEKKIETAIGIVANENKYHPIRDFLNSLAWDGTERIRFCLRHFLGADVDDYTYEALKLFMLGAITRAFKPGSKFEIMLCLVGGQGAGKSTFFRLLAVRDEWFSDDLRKLDDDNVYRKLQGHWIIEMSEMMATANAKSIEEIKSFLSRQKEVYKIPYETHPADRPRQCVFGGTSNALDFLPLDRSGNRRFIPVMVYPEQAEVHILEDEAASRAYISQMWAEAMEIYRSGMFKLAFSPTMQRYLKEHQRDFMPEDTKAGMIQAYLDKSVMESVDPTDVYMTSRYDMHYDHAYFGLFGIEAIKDIQLENEKFQPTVHEAIIHSHMTDEVYPKDQGNYGWNHELDTYLGAWQHLDGLEEKTMLNWSERENVLTPYSMRQGPFKYNLKDKALREYTTEYYNWIASFSKVNEVFYKHETNSIGLFADITASSENSSDSRWDDQSAVKAVDGIADGYATGLANLHTRFPWAEWVTKNEGAGAWLNLAFNEEYKVSTIKLYDRPNTDDQITASHLELDDGTRIEVGELPNDGSVKVINLGEEKVVKNIKFVVDKVSDSTTAVGLAEIEVLGSKAK